MNLDEWLQACVAAQQVFTSREKNAILVSGLGFFVVVNHRIEQLHMSAANYSCQGRLWNGRVQVCGF